jgi:hypothetical protein
VFPSCSILVSIQYSKIVFCTILTVTIPVTISEKARFFRGIGGAAGED